MIITEHNTFRLPQTVSTPSMFHYVFFTLCLYMSLIPSFFHLFFFFCLYALYLPLALYLPPCFTFYSLSLLLHRPPGLTSSPVISDISLIRLSPHAAAGTGESPFSPPHPYVSPHMEHYLRTVHGSPTLSMISAARGLSPAEGEIYPTHQYCRCWPQV